MSMKPAIVVVAYNRVKALQRLLDSLKNADYSGFSDITLIISIAITVRFLRRQKPFPGSRERKGW